MGSTVTFRGRGRLQGAGGVPASRALQSCSKPSPAVLGAAGRLVSGAGFS